MADAPAPSRYMLDGSPCWCVSADDPHEGWLHAPVCLERRVSAEATEPRPTTLPTAAQSVLAEWDVVLERLAGQTRPVARARDLAALGFAMVSLRAALQKE